MMPSISSSGILGRWWSAANLFRFLSPSMLSCGSDRGQSDASMILPVTPHSWEEAHAVPEGPGPVELPGHLGPHIRMFAHHRQAVDMPRVAKVRHDDLEARERHSDSVEHGRVTVSQRRFPLVIGTRVE